MSDKKDKDKTWRVELASGIGCASMILAIAVLVLGWRYIDYKMKDCDDTPTETNQQEK